MSYKIKDKNKPIQIGDKSSYLLSPYRITVFSDPRTMTIILVRITTTHPSLIVKWTINFLILISRYMTKFS